MSKSLNPTGVITKSGMDPSLMWVCLDTMIRRWMADESAGFVAAGVKSKDLKFKFEHPTCLHTNSITIEIKGLPYMRFWWRKHQSKSVDECILWGSAIITFNQLQIPGVVN